MSEERDEGKGSLSFGSWLLRGLTGAVVIYLLAFALLVNIPGVARAANAIGLTDARLETIYYPILKLIGR